MEQAVDSSPAGSHHHALLFPFMSKGHTIPLLHLARLLLRRHITVTVVTTPANRPFISQSLSDTSAAILTLPFTHNVPDIPAGIESSDALPSMSMFYPFAFSTVLMQPAFDAAIQTLTLTPTPPTFMVSDGFLWWTLESANRIHVPRLVSFGMSGHAMSLGQAVGESGILLEPTESLEQLITLPQFPWMKVSKSDFEPYFYDLEATKGVDFDFVMLAFGVASKSHGFVLNTFYELEKAFVDYVNTKGPTFWCVGPLCLAEPVEGQGSSPKPKYVEWLDQKSVEGKPVLFVAFGSQADISLEQLKEIAMGLEDSGANFLWVLRDKHAELLGEEVTRFEKRVEERGRVVKGWVKQREILAHKGVKAFMSHCGWNSIMESVCAGVPVAAWPMAAEQPMNARLVVEEMKVGVRVEACDGSVRGFVKRDGVAKAVKELMEGEKGRQAAERAAELATAARGAMEEGSGSSWLSLDKLIHETTVSVNDCKKT